MHRLFVACVPPPAICQMLLDSMAGVEGGGVEGARWQAQAQLHMTMRFIGDVDAMVAERIADHLSGVRGHAFAVALNGVGYFEKRGKAHTLWAGIAPAEAATALHHKVDRALVSIGLPAEQRAYRPHITLARLSRPVEALAPFLRTHADLGSPPFTLDRFSLLESLPTADGRHYRPVVTVPLR